MPFSFDYYCDRCDAPYCERVNVMNLALEQTEAGYCLACLATLENNTPEGIAATVVPYIKSRDCFLKPWQAFDPADCPLQTTRQCFCQ